MDRAVVLLGLFILATVLLLGQIHTSSSGPSTTTKTTTKPTHVVTKPTTTTTTAPPKPPSNVPVVVANASGVTGAAAAFTSQLQGAGWDTQTPIDASTDVATSAVYYVAGEKTAATEVAAVIHLPASAVLPYTTAAPVSTIGTAEILVVIAADLASGLRSTTTTTGT
ncbi:MAG: LytR C-terminal domain-containing protein [Acidimicrobiales bacterium]